MQARGPSAGSEPLALSRLLVMLQHRRRAEKRQQGMGAQALLPQPCGLPLSQAPPSFSSSCLSPQTLLQKQ